jgi:two-component system, cell cycle sensor histidine kinase and response regulator CckA
MLSKFPALGSVGQAFVGHRGVRPGMAAVLALLALPVVPLAAYALRFELTPYLLVPGAVLALIGLLFLLGVISGAIAPTWQSTQQRFYDAVADATGTAFVVMDGKGRAVYANAAFTGLAAKAGASRLVGFDVLYAGQPEFVTPIYQLAQAAMDGQSLHRDIRIGAGAVIPGASIDGPKWLRLSVAPLNMIGRVGHVLWRLDDITKDRLHQEEAFSRLQFIITYLDNAPAGFFSTLPNGKVDYLNATLAGWLDLDLAMVQGSKLSLEELVGDGVARQLTAITAQAGQSVTQRFLVSIKDKIGSAVPVEIVHRVDFDSAGAVLPSRSMVLRRGGDVTSQEQTDVLHEFTSSAPFGIAEIDYKGEIKRANATFLAMTDRFQQGGALVAAVRDADRENLRATVGAAAAAAGDMRACDVSVEGEVSRNLHLSLVRLPGHRNRITVFALDKTESKALEVQLAQSQKMQAVGQLASGIAHDFNNVLTPIIGFADLLLTKMRPTDPAFADMMNIKQNANRAANLVRQLLAFSRKQTMQPRVHSLTEAMGDLGNLLGRVLGEKVDLSIQHGRDLGLVMVDIHQFEQVIINLAVNARDAMAQGGKLSVRTSNVSREQSLDAVHAIPEGEYVLCEIEDTGTGIPKDIVDKIWEPFFSTKDVGKGTGLGLSMVYGIIKQTGGYIFCDSAVGRGTVFRIYLPRHYPEPSVAATVVAKDVVPARADFTGKGRILVVEDEDSVRAFAVRALSSRGYTVLEANSGEVGLEVIERDTDGFEMILSDVVMPEMDGPSMLAELRKRGVTTKVLFMSGYAEDAFERNLENPDDFAFLQKPFSLKQLLEKVKDVMG